MKKEHQRTESARRERKDGFERRAYTPPSLRNHEKLPVITAGSISEGMWKFEDVPSDPP